VFPLLLQFKKRGDTNRRQSALIAFDSEVALFGILAMPQYQIIDLGFSTADAEKPELTYVGGEIQFSFIDWREQTVRFVASDVCAFAWNDKLDVGDIRDDVTYEVFDSDLIQKYCEAHVISPEEGFRNFKLCFNAMGVLDVLCKGIRLS
jgi:hypothetical protein